MPTISEKDRIITRLTLLDRQPLFRSLDEDTRRFIQSLAKEYHLTFQQLQQVTEIAIDLVMWMEKPLPQRWQELKERVTSTNSRRGQLLFDYLYQQWLSLKNQQTVYQGATKLTSWDWKKRITRHEDNNTVLGMCPVASEKTVCCNLQTLDVIQGCGLGCSYCSIQTFYGTGNISIDTNLSAKLQNIRLNPTRKYHICSGQSSDSLLLENRAHILDAQLAFARRNPNIFLEFKTKSKNVNHLLSSSVPPNVFISWSLNPQTIIDNEEHYTASLVERLMAARRVANEGISVGFHFHPMIYYRGWQKDYEDLIQQVITLFSPAEVALVSFGTLTFIKPVIKSLRIKRIPSKVLQIPMEDTAGKLSYPQKIKEELFRTAWQAFTPWHESVFFYLCMENKTLWESVFGYCFDSNTTFEKALLTALTRKVKTSGTEESLLPVKPPDAAPDPNPS